MPEKTAESAPIENLRRCHGADQSQQADQEEWRQVDAKQLYFGWGLEHG
jgi:hypothetical protein